MKYNLGWGNAIAVRQAFLAGIADKSVLFPLDDAHLDYTAHDGDPTLIEITRRVIERQVGTTYKHIFLVNGATGGVTISLRAYAQQGYKEAITRTPPYFPLYPVMVESAGLRQVNVEEKGMWNKPVMLWDSPGNPSGDVAGAADCIAAAKIPMIHDGVYHSKVYTDGKLKPMHCDVLVGSYSKLTGLNGLRTGWIATNDDLLAVRLKNLVEGEYCGLSSASTAVLLSALKHYQSGISWYSFEYRARTKLDANREEWSKLEKYFGDVLVGNVGMFYYAPADSACQKLLTKAGIAWTKGSQLGATDDFARINLGQDCWLIRDAVKQVIKKDKLR